MPRDPPVTKQDLPVRSVMLNLLDRHRQTEMAGGMPAISVSSVGGSALAGLGRLGGRLDGRLPCLERCLLGSLDELGELVDGLSIALHAEVEQAKAGIDRGILALERRLDGRLALGRPGAQQITAERAGLTEIGARGLDRGLGGLGAVAGGLGGDTGGFGDGRCGGSGMSLMVVDIVVSFAYDRADATCVAPLGASCT